MPWIPEEGTRMNKQVARLLLSALFFCLAAAAQTNPNAAAPTIDESLSVKSAGSPRISPDGRYVAYEVQRTNWEENAFERDLWVAVVATGERYALTHSKKSSTDATWSPDSKWIAFLSDRPGALSGSPEGKRQIWLIPPAGGEARQLTKLENGVNSFAWSP